MAAAVGEQEEGLTELYILRSFYLTEYDVDYTANHDQSIEDVPGVPDIALIWQHAQPAGGEGKAGEEGEAGEV